MTGRTVAAGVAKPIPIEPPEGDRIARLIPITSPAMLNKGPPENGFVDRRVGLKIIVVGTRLDVAMAGRDDARGDRAAKPKGIADGDHPIAHAHLFAVAKLHRLERLLRFHPKHGDIDFFILANHFSAFSFWPSVKMTITSLASATT